MFVRQVCWTMNLSNMDDCLFGQDSVKLYDVCNNLNVIASNGISWWPTHNELCYSLTDVVPSDDVNCICRTSTAKIQVSFRESGDKMGIYTTASRDEVRMVIGHFIASLSVVLCVFSNQPVVVVRPEVWERANSEVKKSVNNCSFRI